MANEPAKLVILGSGPAALTAAIYTARAELLPIVVQGSKPGGQLMGTSMVENWPGNESILGPRLMQNMLDHAKQQGAKLVGGSATSLTKQNGVFLVKTDQGAEYHSKVVLIATGSSARQLNCPGETDYWGKWITTCAVCDGALYKNKKVLVVGGGDSGVEDALFLTKFTTNVTLLQNKDYLTASKINQKRILENKHISIIYDSSILRFEEDQGRRVYVKNFKTEQVKVMSVDGVFLAIGLIPNTKFCADLLDLDQWGYIVVNNTLSTSEPGIFAAGDVQDSRYRQAITAAGSGCKAALEIERYLSALD